MKPADAKLNRAMVPPTDDEQVDDDLRQGKPAGLDLEAKKWQADIAARLFGETPTEVHIGRYVVQERVGEGAAGVVYAAHDPKLDRKVAIKLLRTDVAPGDRSTDAWLVREAKTLARLSHPNVLPVYDVGTHAGQVFMALELVTGATLQQWLAKEPQLDAIVDAFTQAARGLAAAHNAGLVHRDFKPANVLVGDDGRVRVSDFGIAGHLDRGENTTATERDGSTERSAGADVAVTYARAGTPAYMAPEQFLGDPVDGRTDQFGFCVTLHEAVYGRRPFAGNSRATLAANVIAGRRSTQTDRALPPAWLERLIARGLKIDPEQRYASMDAVADVLARAGGGGRLRWVVGSAVAAAAAAAVVVSVSGSREPSACDDGEATMARVWSPERAKRIADAFRATKVPYAEDSFRRVDEAVRAYGERWTDAYAAACEGQTEVIVVRRLHCLQSRLLELESLGEVLADADEPIVENSVFSVGALVGPDECLYVGSPPGEPANPDTVGQDTQLRSTIARAKVMGDAGHPRQGLVLARQAVQAARDLGDRTLEAEALLVAGSIERGLAGIATDSDPESTIYKAILAAEASHRPDLSARALVEYLSVAETLGHFGRLEQWEQRAQRAVAAIGSPPTLQGRIEYTMALVYDSQNDAASSRAAVQRALETFRQGGPSSRRYLTSAYNLLGELTFDEGRYEDALPYYERAFEVVVDTLGPNHSLTANAFGNTAEVYFKLGQYEESLSYFERSLAIRLDVFGPTSVWSVHTMAHVGDLRLKLGRVDEAIEIYERALQTRMELRALAGDRPREGENTLAIYRDLQAWDQEQWLHNGLALAYLDQGDVQTALRHGGAIADPIMPEDRHHPDLIGRIDARGRTLLAAGRLDEAAAALEAAARAVTDWYAPDASFPGWAIEAQGTVELQRGNPARAREYFQAALSRRATWSVAHPRAMGDVRFGLAQALRDLGQDRTQAVELARQAHDDYTRAPNARTDDVSRVEAWLMSYEATMSD